MSVADPFQLVGQTIAGKYRVERLLGEGGFGVVYAGTHLTLGEPVAIKCLKVSGEPAAADGFLREARVLFALTHPAIVRMYDIGTMPTPLGETPYVVLELVQGTSLEEELARRLRANVGGFTPAEILAVFEPVLDALYAAHKRGVAHRDLKPANIMLVAGDGGAMTAKLLDFGTARVGNTAIQGGAAAATAAAGFTPRYAAPEQWDPSLGTTGPASDVFSLGLILAETCTLTPMLPGESATEILTEVMRRDRIVAVSARRYDLPPQIDGIVAKATRVALPERFASVAELRDALRATLGPAASTMRRPMLASHVGYPQQAAPRGFAATTSPQVLHARAAPPTSGWQLVALGVVLGVVGVFALLVFLLGIARPSASAPASPGHQDAGAVLPAD